jgi:hypothetical protein
LTTALANDEIAYDSDPLTAAPRGVLVEGARTNLCTRSEVMTAAAWNKNNITVTAAAGTAPDGLLTACSVAETGTGRHAIGKVSAAVTPDAVYVWSVYVKPVAGGATRYPVLYLTSSSYQAGALCAGGGCARHRSLRRRLVPDLAGGLARRRRCQHRLLSGVEHQLQQRLDRRHLHR